MSRSPKPKKNPKPKKSQVILLFCFAALFCVSVVQVLRILGGLQEEEKEFAALSAYRAERQAESPGPAGTSETSETGEDGQKLLASYESLYQKNPDLAGWLCIDGTKLNYPVMYTPEDPEYYLYRSFSGEKSVSGVPFIGAGSSPDGTNITIYGHNMKNGTMFAALLKYAGEDFWREHPVIRFDNLYEEHTYEVVGAFYSKVSDQDGIFNYYQYPELNTPELFEEYYRQVKAASLYDTGVEAEYGDQLLTLSTCSYHTKDGRFVVVARKTDTEEK